MYPGLFSTKSSSVEKQIESCSIYSTEGHKRLNDELSQVLRVEKYLEVKTSVYYDNFGNSLKLVLLSGKIQITILGKLSDIPMSFWFTKNYPKTPPLVYVTPETNMKIVRNHENVAADGQCNFSYLKKWNRIHSSMIDLIKVCKVCFSNLPPMIAKEENYNITKDLPPPAYSVSSKLGNTNVNDNANNYNTGADIYELSAARTMLILKIKDYYPQVQLDMKSGLNNVLNDQKKLQEGSNLLCTGITELEKQITQFESIISDLDMKQVKLLSWLQEFELAENASEVREITLDDMIVPADKLSNQIIDCFSRFSACDDILFNLDEALRNDVINPKNFLKTVRKLARMQFMDKALAKKLYKHYMWIESQKSNPLEQDSRPPAYYSNYH